MNKMTKLGVSALCGSLAAVSAANAGALSVSGGIDMSWVSFDVEVTGSPIGIGLFKHKRVSWNSCPRRF